MMGVTKTGRLSDGEKERRRDEETERWRDSENEKNCWGKTESNFNFLKL